MKRPSIQLLAVSAAVAMFASVHQAKAQTAGTYAGTIADGNTISFVVTPDGSGGLAITSFNYGITATCHPGSSTFNTGWGLGPNASIKHSKASFIYSFGYLYLKASFVFSGSDATGTVASVTPTFAPVASGKPKRAVFCSSPLQSFTTSFTTAPAIATRLAGSNAPVFIPNKK